MNIPYKLTAAVSVEQRRAHMAAAISRANAKGWPRLQMREIDAKAVVSIACFGPSLRDTWQDLKPPILSMSGATKFLAERGITPTWHCEMDPRVHKAATSLPPVPGVTYLVASVCAPAYFDQLGDAPVILWHAVSSKWDDELAWVSAHDPGELVVSTGTTVGLGAIQLGGLLGFRRFEIHGMDGSFADGVRHAGHHAGKNYKPGITWAAGGVTYHTIEMMASAAAETINTLQNQPIFAVFHGQGLTQALVREAKIPTACCADETEKRAWQAGQDFHAVDVPPIPEGRGSVWDGFMACLAPTDLPDLVAQIGICEPRRARARYNTGAVPFETAVLLRAMTRFYQPQVIAEVGTFIGMSTHALDTGRRLDTCDRSNDCLPATERITPHPYQSSTDMLRTLTEPVDLFFFDGRIQEDDLPHIARLSHPRTVYLFDDVAHDQKGIANLQRLQPQCPRHVLLPPSEALKGRSTLGALLPRRAA